MSQPRKILAKSRWVTNTEPKHISIPVHGSSVVTYLVLSHERIISASDDHTIQVHSSVSGERLLTLDGHEGGVWSLAVHRDILVSGSTDRTVRVWDLLTGKCTHVFGEHASTVRVLTIVKPEWVDVKGEGNVVAREKWPEQPLIVTGSRDKSLRVWSLPRPGEEQYKWIGLDGEISDNSGRNPYHKLHLQGHEQHVRGISARGRTAVSGSYDNTVRVWDIITGECKWVLVGHTGKVYSVVFDPSRNQVYSGGMDGDVRVWDLQTGQCMHNLMGHASLVGLLGLSPSYLVSAAADSTLRVWDPDTGELRQELTGHTGAITCFHHDEYKLLSGSDGGLKMWDMREGTVVKELLKGITGVWQVVFEGQCCVAASNKDDISMLDVWDFGAEDDEGWTREPARKQDDEWSGDEGNGRG